MRCAALVLSVLVACQPPPAEFGALTDDGLAAIKEHCGDALEYTSTWRGKRQDEVKLTVIRDAKNLLALNCHSIENGKWGTIALDAITRKVLLFGMELKVNDFDRFVERVVTPVLDESLRNEFSRLRNWIRTRRPSDEPGKTWYGRGVYLGVTEYENPRRWEVSFGYLEKGAR